ncbi:Rhs element Vgr family protein, partial [Yersinia pestis PY-95]
MLAIPR